MPVLLREAKKYQMSDELANYVSGFMDTLPAFRENFPGQASYSQTALYTHFVRQNYDAHDALEDVRSLQRLIQAALIPFTTLQSHTYSFESATEYVDFLDIKRRLLATLTPHMSCLSKTMLDKIAASGLTYQHLHLAFQRGGSEGLRNLLREPNAAGKARVTTCSRVLDLICKHFNK